MTLHRSFSRYSLSVLIPAVMVGQAFSQLSVSVIKDFQAPTIRFDAPDPTRHSVESIKESVPDATEGYATIHLTEGNRFLDEAFRRERGTDLQQRQGVEATRLIVVESGVLTLDKLVEAIADPEVIDLAGGVATLRLPLLINPGATLVIDGATTRGLRLSMDRGAFLHNAGKLYVLDSEVLGWDESAGGPCRFVDKQRFRPYLASLVRSETYLAGSRFESLGFAAPTAYGMSLSSHPERAEGEATADSPTGVLVGNTFVDLYYGFYSYEARDVAIIGNTYDKCIVYGIDPHDCSTRLLIARNTTINTVEKHGIIGSRGVSDSFIIDNVSHGNTGSGVMLDRQCRNNVVAGNVIYDNGQGVALYESPDNLVTNNFIVGSKKSGIRVRNCVGVQAVGNTLIRNGDYAFEFSSKRLDDHAKREARGDLYEIAVDVAVFNNRLVGNRGFAKASGLGRLHIAGVTTGIDANAIAAEHDLSLPPLQYVGEDKKLGGDLSSEQYAIEEAFDAASPLIVVEGAEAERSGGP